MRAILILSSRITVAISVLYGLLIVLSVLIFPMPSASRPLDTGQASETIFETQARYLVLNRGSLIMPTTRVIFLGSSNTAIGFPVSLVQPLMPGALVSNAALDGSNLTQIREAFTLVRDALTLANRRRTVYVIGLWYGLFADDSVWWNKPGSVGTETPLDEELYRYGFYRRTRAGPVEVVPADKYDIAIVVIYPFMALEKVVRTVTEPVRERYLGAQPNRTDAERNIYVPTSKAKKEQTNYWIHSFAGTQISRRQFAALAAIVDQAEADQSRIILVDLPIPAWHMAALPYDSEYERDLREFLALHENGPLLSYVDMRDMRRDTWFSDEVHPKPIIVPLWVHRLVSPIKTALHRS